MEHFFPEGFGSTGQDSITGLTIDDNDSIYAAMTNFSTGSKSVVTVMKFNSSNLLTPIWSKNLASGDHTVTTVAGGPNGCRFGGDEIDLQRRHCDYWKFAALPVEIFTALM